MPFPLDVLLARERSIQRRHPTAVMRYFVLATDYDGTLAHHGQTSEAAIGALKRVRASGRKLLLVTGRHLPDLKTVFSSLDIFHRVVVENGALWYNPETREERLLCEPPNPALLELLRRREVPFSAARGVIATWEPHQTAVLDAIKELGLGLQVIFNKGAVMVLPSGVNKASGLIAALDELRLSPHNVVGIGDAENDHDFLSACECGVAVANALPALKERADFVTERENGNGVIELAEQLLADDLEKYDGKLNRHTISLGTRVDDKETSAVRISPYRNSILIIGPSASGKSTAVSGIVEQLADQKYQFCLIDPEGDYENCDDAVAFGSAKEKPEPNAVIKALESPRQNVVVNLMAISVGDRPGYCSGLLPRLSELRAQTARPHWIIIDEAHHLLPTSWSPASTTLPQALGGTILVTVHPEKVSTAALSSADVVIATGLSAGDSLRAFARAVQAPEPNLGETAAQPGHALVWFHKQTAQPVLIRTQAGRAERKRHRRSYAEGKLSEEQSFYFRGPDGKLQLRAQNLMMFLQMAEGVDDETWTYHLQRGEYSSWFRDVIKDPDLANVVAAVEHDKEVLPVESRKRIREAVESRYTAAA